MARDPLHRIRQLKQVDEIWEVATRLMRTWITPKDADPYRPYQITFVTDRGKIVRSRLNEMAHTPDQLWDELCRAMRRPGLGAGRKRRPKIIALNDRELVRALTPRLAEIGIQCEYRRDLPHLEDAIQETEKFLNRKSPEAPSMLSVPGVTVPLLGHIFTAAVEFYHLAPWEMLSYEVPIEIRYPANAQPRYVVVMGAAGEAFGISVNDSLSDLQRMFSGIHPEQLTREISWFTLTYDIPLHLAFDDLDAIIRYGWPVANKQAYPAIVRVGPTPDFHPPTKKDVFWVAGALPALTVFFQKHLKLNHMGIVHPTECTIAVQTLSSLEQVYVRIPAPQEPVIEPQPATQKRRRKRKKEIPFEIGDSVVVKTGVKDTDLGYDLSGWQGRIVEIDEYDHEPDIVTIYWDSTTLKNIPSGYIEQSEMDGMSWAEYRLYPGEVEKTKSRDTQADVKKTIEKLKHQYVWAFLGEEGRRIQKVLAGIDPEDEWECFEAWFDHLEKSLTFPFTAEVSELQTRGPLQAGNIVRVIGLSDVDDLYGVLVDVKKGRRKYVFPLCDLEVKDEKSPLFQVVQEYAVWFANR
ncbi:MAG: calcium-binding protein [Anaerolineales bacterium]